MKLLFLVLCFSGFVSTVFSDEVIVGVYDQRSAGGQGASVDRLIDGLNDHGFRAVPVTDLNSLTLCQVDILYLSDMHHPGRAPEHWKENVKEFVEKGGSVLQTWHHHILGEVGVGVKRVYDRRHMCIAEGHAAVEGLQDFDASFKDHIIERVGTQGTVIIVNEREEPVASAGMIGKGKVISTGLALGIPNGQSAVFPKGAEAAVLRSFLDWLKPGESRATRFAEILDVPRLEIWPPVATTAAGFTASFQAEVGVKTPEHVRLTCGKGEVQLLSCDEPMGDEGPHVWTYNLSIETPTGHPSEVFCPVEATIGETQLLGSLHARSVFGPVPERERRGVWLHVGEDRHPEKVMPELRELGIEMVVLRIAGGTAAFYGSKVQRDIKDPLEDEGGDWLAEAVNHAHLNGIEIHPYVNNCIVEGRTSPESLARLREERRLQETAEGEPIGWFCPSQEENIAVMEAVMYEIVSDYDVDGVQYDFIRYPNATGCFCEKCRQLFEKETGTPVENWPTDVLGEGSRYEEWVEFRCRRISSIVKRISSGIRQRNPKVQISAAVFSDWPGCRTTVGQDWKRWCEEGWLDFVCPMNYTLDPQRFLERSSVHGEIVPDRVPILEGIGIDSGAGKMTDPQTLAVQISMARAAGASGFVGFCYRPEHTAALFTPLRSWLSGGESAVPESSLSSSGTTLPDAPFNIEALGRGAYISPHRDTARRNGGRTR